MIKRTIFTLSALLFVAGIGYSYAEPFDTLEASVLEYDGDSAVIQLTWHVNESVSHYDVGCVSCMPNVVQSTISPNIILEGVTPFTNSSTVMLYVLAYNTENEVIQAKQIILNLEQ
jgi:hypothetical protein